MRWGGEGVKRPWRRERRPGPGVIDPPSIRLSLVGLRPRRARLRFAGPLEDNASRQEKKASRPRVDHDGVVNDFTMANRQGTGCNSRLS